MKLRGRLLRDSSTTIKREDLIYRQRRALHMDEDYHDDEKGTGHSHLEAEQQGLQRHIKYEKTHESISDDGSTPRSYSNPNIKLEQEYSPKPEFELHATKLKTIGPDIDDPNFYCRSCRFTYKNKKGYRLHLRRYHKMALKSLHFSTNPDVLPDWDDPKQYCKSCNRSYSSRSAYRCHCKLAHNMKKPTGTPDINDPNNYCKICDYTYKSRYGYNMHCFMAHKVNCRQKFFANPEATPDMADPNNYCSKCDKSYSSRTSFKIHLLRLHKIVSTTTATTPISNNNNNNNNINLGINNCGLYCQTCDKTLSSKFGFKRHLTAVHFMGQSLHKKNKSNPDVNDPHHYCCICQRSYSSRTSYRIHLQAVHRLVLERRR
ncbi:unnamed protein product [Mucor fragilis]